MSEKIPDSSPNNNPPAAVVFSSTDLPPLQISASIYRCWGECAIYCSMLVSASVALWPFLLTAWYWPLVWLLFLATIFYNIRAARARLYEPPNIISVHNHLWRLRDLQGEIIVEPFGEILLWSWLIVLPLRNPVNKQKRYLVAFKDSMATEDWRRLRVWLRIYFRESISK